MNAAAAHNVYSNRQCAQAIIDLTSGTPPTASTFLERLAQPIRKLMAREDFLSLGVKRQSNHTGEGSRWLYYDGQTSIVLDQLPMERKVSAHDHGVWEAIVVYRGALSHAMYRRTDDGNKEGYAELETLEDRIMKCGDAALLVEPADIHSFFAIEPDTYFITVMGGPYKKYRNYYNPIEKTVVVRQPGGG